MKIVANLSSIGATILFLAGMLSTQAATITVNNNVGAVADHDNMTDAIAAASAGDTLLVAGSATSYGTATLTKQLKIVGPGYFLGATENNVPGVTPGVDDQPATMILSFAGATNGTVGGSRFVGLTVSGLTFGAVDTDLLFDRCYFTASPYINGGTDIRFTRCFFGDSVQIQNSTNCTLIGCSMRRLFLQDGAVASHCTIRGWAANNYTAWLTVDAASALTNSIIWRRSLAGLAGTGSITHCVGINIDLAPTGTGNPDINNNYDNIANGSVGTVFVAAGSSDGYYQLNTTGGGNPAIGNASDGSDIGFTGGPVPYRLAGQPSIPKISNLVVPGLASPTSGLNVKVTVSEPTP